MKIIILLSLLSFTTAYQYVHLYTGYLTLDGDIDSNYGGNYNMFKPIKYGSPILCDIRGEINYYMEIEVLTYGNLTCYARTAQCSRQMNRTIAIVINERASLPPCSVIYNNDCQAYYLPLDNKKTEFSITLPTYQESNYCVNPSYVYIGLQTTDDMTCSLPGIPNDEIFCMTQPIIIRYEWYQYCQN